jgi:hypothetical protein
MAISTCTFKSKALTTRRYFMNLTVEDIGSSLLQALE